MTAPTPTDLPDLTGSVDERLTRLDDLESRGVSLPPAWLRVQLRNALTEWAADETALDITRETRADY